MRNRKYANPNAVGPTGRVVTSGNYSEVKDVSLSLISSGNGPILSDVSYDDENKQIIVTRTSTKDIHTRESLRRGIAMHDVDAILLDKGVPAVGPEKWFPFENEAIIEDDSPLLPDTFTHASGFSSSDPWVKNLPAGMAWVRLASGSSPVGGAAWDADEDNYSVTAIPEDGRGPTLKACTIDAVNRVVTLWFDQPLNQDQQFYYKNRRKIKLRSNKAAIKVVGNSLKLHESYTSALVLSIDRQVGLDEDIYINISQHMVRGTKRVSSRRASAVSCNIVADKNCYVLCMFTYSPVEETSSIAEGSTVLLGSPLSVLDNQTPEDQRMPYIVQAMSPMGVGGGGDSAEAYGMVWGGTGGSISTGRMSTRYRVYSEWSLKNFAPVTVVTDWSLYTLPEDWTPADEIANSMPFGVGYVRLLPLSPPIAGKSWVDDSFLAKTDPIDSPPTIIDMRVSGETKLYITWNQPVAIINPPPTITASGGAIVVSGGSNSFDNIIEYVLDRPVSSEESLSLNSLAEWVEAAHDNAFKSPSISGAVRNISVRNSMVLVAHRVQPSILYRGQIVKLQDTGFDVTDDNGVTMRLVDVIPSANSIPEHHHSSQQDGGYAISHAWSGL